MAHDLACRLACLIKTWQKLSQVHYRKGSLLEHYGIDLAEGPKHKG